VPIKKLQLQAPHLVIQFCSRVDLLLQLTFGLKSSKNGVNFAQLFNDWLKSSSSMLDNFSLVPFENADAGQQITSERQIPTDSTTF
jgi:hypothetical protein